MSPLHDVAYLVTSLRQVSPFFDEDKVSLLIYCGEHRWTFTGANFVTVGEEQVRRE